MFRVLGCIFEQHDQRLVLLAGVLCLFACVTAMSMIWRARVAPARQSRIWLVAAGVVAGSGIWSTHFVAMLAYQGGFPVAYAPGLTALSALIAMTMCGVGFATALIGRQPILGGGITGAAIGAMHYVGMAAVRAPADAFWDWRYVAASVVIGVGLMAYGMHFTLRRTTLRSYFAGAVIFTLAICRMHFTGMSAVTFKFNPQILVTGTVLEPVTLAVAVASAAILIVALGLIGALIDHHLVLRGQGEAERLRSHIVELEATKAALEDTSRELSRALGVAAAANHTKSSFLANVSHELRTPLNAIIGFSEMLGMEMLGPLGHRRYQDYVGDIHQSGVHLLQLINEILDLSRIDAGDKRLDEEVVDLRKLIGQSLKMIRPQALAAGIELEADLESALPALHADPRRLKQVLINLLGNAVKFTPAKGTVTVSARETGEGVVITVADTGIGIAPEDIPRALERFGQVDSRLSRKYEGVGLGLPLAKQFVELHGGTLTLESALDVGTTATITLPSSRIVSQAASEGIAAA